VIWVYFGVCVLYLGLCCAVTLWWFWVVCVFCGVFEDWFLFCFVLFSVFGFGIISLLIFACFVVF